MTTDLKPGDIVQHPEHGFGFIVLLKKDLGDVPASEAVVRSTNPRRNYGHAWDLDGWERVETVRPGHVQVRVNDLDLSHWLNKQEDDDIWGEASRVAIRAAKAIAAKRAESTPTADEKPTSTTVTLYCPDCGEAVHVTVVMLGRQGSGERWLGLRDSYVHTCPPRHADEPTEAGILLEIKYLRYVSIVLKGRVGYVSVDQGGIFEWSYLVNLANEMNESIKLGWGQE